MHGPLSVSSMLFAGRYTVEREIGRGATATVFLARDTERGQDVAIKVLRPELAEAAGKHRFLKETRLTSRLHHPRILQILDAGEYEGQLYLVLPFMEGGTLRDRLTRERQLHIADAVAITRTIADALDYAHRHGLIHRDIKPENILFHEGEACVADFGIARALEKALDDTSTSTGIVRGTPAYMSPEQASGEHDYDGRTDIFSLGCVLYEMLAGVGAFIGATAEAVLAQRFMHPPRDLRVYRPSVPAELEAAIRRAVAFEPADRYRSAGEFAQALAAVSTDPVPVQASATRLLPRVPRLWWRRRNVRVAIASVVVACAVALAGAAEVRRRARVAMPEPDTTHLVVLPLERPGDGGARTIDDDLFHEALSRWRGLVLVDRFQVADALRRTGPIESSSEAATLSRSLGALRYVRGQLTREGATWRAYAALYEVGGMRALYQATEEIPADVTAALAAYARLADSLLLRGAPGDTSSIGATDGHSLPAIQAVHRAHRALDEWDLAAADSFFQLAMTSDRYSARPTLWLAQVRSWMGLSPVNWSSLADQALKNAGSLSEKERKLARALVLLGQHRFEDACRVYDELRLQNARDFAAWFGLGQCRTMDKAVVRDASSPSGWRFRSSYGRAVAAYTTAFEILPSVHRDYERGAFERLRMLMAVSTALFTGYDIERDSAVFYARPAWLGDTLALVPYHWQVVHSGSSNAIPPGFTVALERQRATFRRIAAGWSAAFPHSAGAKHAVAIALELLNDPAAIDTVRLARQLATDSSRRLQLAAAEVLMLVRFGTPDNVAFLRGAQALTDSLLSRGPESSVARVEALATLAALGGRCDVAEALARRPEPVAVGALRIAPSLFADGNALLARTALGCRPAHTTPTLAELARSIERAYSRDERRRIDEVLLFRPALLAMVPDSGVITRLAASSEHGLLQAASAQLRGDTARVRSALSGFASQWHPELGAPTPDIAYPGARLWAAIGDTTMAIDWLDRTLGGIQTFDPRMLTEQARVAALLRAMVLRAELAGATGDSAGARRWARAVIILWANADRDLQPVVARMSRHVTQR